MVAKEAVGSRTGGAQGWWSRRDDQRGNTRANAAAVRAQGRKYHMGQGWVSTDRLYRGSAADSCDKMQLHPRLRA